MGKTRQIIKLDEFHYHEVVDRTSLLLDTFFEKIEEHPAVLANSELLQKAENVVKEMYEFYTLAAVYSDKELADEEDKKPAEFYEYFEEEDEDE